MHDDQLTHDLGDAFRAATADLTYAGRVPTPRRTPLIVVPAVVAGTAAVALAVASVTSGGHSGQAHAKAPSAASPTSIRPVTTAPTRTRLVTKKLKLAGYTLVYSQPSGNDPLYGRIVSAVPASATQVPTGGPAKDWVGVDPATGYNTAFVDLGNGRILAITSADATRDELVTMLQAAQPRTIPLVGATDR
jgi:hypothetical protein